LKNSTALVEKINAGELAGSAILEDEPMALKSDQMNGGAHGRFSVSNSVTIGRT
jgi:hypothetical protein